MAESPRSIDELSVDELKAGFVELQEAFADLESENEALREEHADLENENEALREERADLKSENETLREEIARLKGLKGRPKLKPSGMHQETQARAKAKSGGRKRRRGPKNSRLVIDEDKVLKPAGVPKGSRFKGTQDYVVQDLIIKSHVVRFRRQRWVTPEGRTIVAPLPAGIDGHFGAQLRRFVLMQYHQGQMTIPRLVELLGSIGVAISKRQVVRILTQSKPDFRTEARDVLRAGLQSASWISVDDTGARHRGRNGVCTQIGNDHFTAFVTTFSKSR
ncbi:MAG: transposase, partial [bacterium]|nr:transposase [bacterium]